MIGLEEFCFVTAAKCW